MVAFAQDKLTQIVGVSWNTAPPFFAIIQYATAALTTLFPTAMSVLVSSVAELRTPASGVDDENEAVLVGLYAILNDLLGNAPFVALDQQAFGDYAPTLNDDVFEKFFMRTLTKETNFADFDSSMRAPFGVDNLSMYVSFEAIKKKFNITADTLDFRVTVYFRPDFNTNASWRDRIRIDTYKLEPEPGSPDTWINHERPALDDDPDLVNIGRLFRTVTNLDALSRTDIPLFGGREYGLAKGRIRINLRVSFKTGIVTLISTEQQFPLIVLGEEP